MSLAGSPAAPVVIFNMNVKAKPTFHALGQFHAAVDTPERKVNELRTRCGRLVMETSWNPKGHGKDRDYRSSERGTWIRLSHAEKFGKPCKDCESARA